MADSRAERFKGKVMASVIVGCCLTSGRHVGVRMRRIVPVKMMSKLLSVIIRDWDRGAAAPRHLGLDGGRLGRLQPAGGRGLGGVVEQQGVLGLEPAGGGWGAVGCQAVLH